MKNLLLFNFITHYKYLIKPDNKAFCALPSLHFSMKKKCARLINIYFTIIQFYSFWVKEKRNN